MHIIYFYTLYMTCYYYVKQESTKHTPFEVMFGRTARLPVDINMEGEYSPEDKLRKFLDCEQDNIEKNMEIRTAMEDSVKENIRKAQVKQKKTYDQKHGAINCFTVDSAVLKKDFTRKKRRGGKLDYRWEGPFIITKALGKGLYQLKESNGTKVTNHV